MRSALSNPLRDAWVEINLDYLEQNVKEIKKYIKSKRILAVVKADGYGHGSLMMAPVLTACGITDFGVATLDEGLELRRGKVKEPILVLGAVPYWGFENALKNNIQVSVFQPEHLEAAKILYEKTHKKLNVQVKVDTGMNRIGINVNEAKNFIDKVLRCEAVRLTGIFTHFCDTEDIKIFESQKKAFKNLISSIDTTGITVHCANSGAILLNENLDYDMVRAGIILYGLTPFSKSEYQKKFKNLKQLISLRARITNIHKIRAGEGVSYGHKFKAKHDTTIATIPVGYADGVSRVLSGKIKGLLGGEFIKQVGNITMDQMMFEIPDNSAKIGDTITLLGNDGNNFISIDEWADILNTINYELICRLKVRLPRIYTR